MDLGLNLDTVRPVWGKYRSFVGRCCQKCTSKSWGCFFHKRLASMGFCNAINITEENTRYRGWLVRRLCHFLTVCEWRVSAEMPPNLQERLLHAPRVQAVVSPKGSGDAPGTCLEWTKEIRRILGQIQGRLSPFLLRFCHWILLKFLTRIFLRVIVHRGQLEMVHKAEEANTPMVFLSTHKSHLDGLWLPFLLVSQGVAMPRVAWENKTFTPTYRALLASLGGVFLPQGMGQSGDLEESAFSRAVVASYVEELLLTKQPLLVFLEEVSSGSQQLSPSGRAWLSLVLSAYYTRAIPDILIVPVGISYERTPDFIHKGKESPTQTLGLWATVWSLCQAACCGQSYVRIDFAQPFSLQVITEGWIKEQREKQAVLIPKAAVDHLLILCFNSPSILDCEKVECWPTSFQDVVPLTSIEEQVLLDNLSLHTLSGVSCSAIMAVHILSALLLHMHQEGVFLSRLMQDFVWITDEVLMRNYDVGFSGRVRDVLWHGLSLLRDCVTLYSLSLGEMLVVPKKTEAAIKELGHHSTALLPVFIQEAIGACSINALLMEVIPYLGSPEQLGNFVLTHEELHNKSVLLVQLLPKDFLLRQPCESVHYYCQHTVDKLVESGLLVAEEVPSDCFMCDTVQKGFTEKFLWKATEDFVDIDGQDEAEKQCFKVSQSESCSNLFVFLCGLLGPLLKTLERAAVFLQEQDFPQPESQFMEKLQRELVRLAREDGSFECANGSLAATSVRICKELGVFKEATEDNGPLLHLSDPFTAQENQKKLEKFIHQFIY